MSNVISDSNETVHAYVVAGSTHDNLLETLDGIAESTRQPVYVVVAVTSGGFDVQAIAGSLKERFGDRGRVVNIGRQANFGCAIRAAQTSDAVTALGKPDWLWLFHDDAVAEPTALAQLLEQVNQAQGVAVVGPKQVEWGNRDHLLEAGIDATRSGTRVALTAPGEIDQGQYDDRQDVLAVGSVAMLVRADVWSKLRGFDPHLGPFGDGLEFGRRVRRAGYRVLVAPKAVVAHKQRSLAPNGDIDQSFRARRAARLYNWCVAMPAFMPLFAILGLFFWTPVRALSALLTRKSHGASAEMGAYWDLVKALPAVGRARRRTRKVAKVPRSALRTVELSRSQLRKRRAALRRVDRRGIPERQQIDQTAQRLRIKARNDYLLAFFSTVIVACIVSVVGWYRFFPGIEGGAWANLPADWSQIWTQSWSRWVLAGDGSPGPVNPMLPVFAIASLPLAIFGVSPLISAVVFMVCALPLAAIGGWAIGGCFTRSTPLRVGSAAAWAGQPALIYALTSGNIPGVVAWVSLPVVVVGLCRATRLIPPIQITGVEETVFVRRFDAVMWGAIASFGAMAFVSAAPGLLPVLIAVAYLMATLPAGSSVLESRALVEGNAPSGARIEQQSARATLRQRLVAATIVWIPAFVLTVHSWTSNWSGNLLQRFFDPTGAEFASSGALEILTGAGDGSVLGFVSGGLLAACALVSLLVTTFAKDAHPWQARVSGAVGALVLLWIVGSQIFAAQRFQYTALYAVVAVCWLITTLSMVRDVPVHVSPARTGLWRQRFGSVPLVASGVLGSVVLIMLLFGGSLTPAPSPRIPFVAEQAQNGPRASRLLVIENTDQGIEAELMRGVGLQQADLSLGIREPHLDTVDAARSDLAQAIGTLAANPSSKAVEKLSEHAVDVVLLAPGDAQDDLMDNLDASGGLERIGTTELGAMWRVRPSGAVPGRVMIDSEAIDAGPLTVNTQVDVAKDSVVYVAEAADAGWSASFNGVQLERMDDKDEWRTAFEIPSGSGKLSIQYRPVSTAWWAISVAVVSGVALVLAMPWRPRKGTWVVLASGGDDVQS